VPGRDVLPLLTIRVGTYGSNAYEGPDERTMARSAGDISDPGSGRTSIQGMKERGISHDTLVGVQVLEGFFFQFLMMHTSFIDHSTLSQREHIVRMDSKIRYG